MSQPHGTGDFSALNANAGVRAPPSVGLPAVDASDDEVYRIAESLSRLRESVPIPDDGV
jgi:hypothetical protein